MCGNSIRKLKIDSYLNELEGKFGISVERFSDFEPNPTYDSVVKGVDAFHACGADAIIGVGGGSALDVAKAIKLFSNMDKKIPYVEQKIIPNEIKFIAMPTTAGTGSEATRYSIITYKENKLSVTDVSGIPDIVFFDPSVLTFLPDYQKKSTMLDALCHAVEAFWSVSSTEESKDYSRQAISLILSNIDGYLKNVPYSNEQMLLASNYAGKAINIAPTTAGHAMSYKLTSMYGLAHGHAVALCVSKLWPYMIENIDKCLRRPNRL